MHPCAMESWIQMVKCWGDLGRGNKEGFLIPPDLGILPIGSWVCTVFMLGSWALLEVAWRLRNFGSWLADTRWLDIAWTWIKAQRWSNSAP